MNSKIKNNKEMKARLDISGSYNGVDYDFDAFDIDFELAKMLNKGDYVYLMGRECEEVEAVVEYKWLDLIDNKLVLNCTCG